LLNFKNWLLSNRNLTTLTLTALLGGLYCSMFRVIWQPFALSLGASITFIGILGSISTLDGGFFTMLIQPFGGWLGDQIGRKYVLYISSGIVILCFSVFILAGLLHLVWLLVPAAVLIGLTAINRPSRSAMISESVKGSKRGMAFSIVSMAMISPGIFAAVIGGFVYQKLGFFWIFSISIFLECLILGFVFRGLKETLIPNQVGDPKINIKKTIVSFFSPNRDLLGIYLFNICDGIAWSITPSIINSMLIDRFGYSTIQLGIMTSVLFLSWTVLQLPIGRLVDKIGAWKMLMVCEFLGIPLAFIWALQPSFVVFIFAQVLFGITSASFVPSFSTLLSNQVHSSQLAHEFGKAAGFRGLISFPMPAIGGLLYTQWGFVAPPLATLLFSFISLLVLLSLVREKRFINLNLA